MRGALTAAGELGHVPAVPGGEACTCGQRGCLEVYLSGAGVARRYAALGGLPGLDTAAVVARVGGVEGQRLAEAATAAFVHGAAVTSSVAAAVLVGVAVTVVAGLRR